MDFKFSVDELIVVVAGLRGEYRKSCECATVARKKQLSASTDENAREFLDIAKYYDDRCEKCVKAYEKIMNRNIVEDL